MTYPVYSCLLLFAAINSQIICYEFNSDKIYAIKILTYASASTKDSVKIIISMLYLIAIDLFASCFIAAIDVHDDVIKWKHFPRYWSFVQVIHWSTVDSPHKGQWRGPLMFSLICAWINGWGNNHKAGDLRRHRARYDVIVISYLLVENMMDGGGEYRCKHMYILRPNIHVGVLVSVVVWCGLV